MHIRHCPPTSGDEGRGNGASRARSAVTLIELLIVIGILGVLASIVIASFSMLVGHGQAEALSATVHNVRKLIEIKSIAPDVPLAPSGHPAQIDPGWFQGNRMPYHTWTNNPMIVETVAAADDQVYPAVKTFDPDDPGAADAWYNTTNGAFCVRVGDGGGAAAQLEAFNTANNATATSLEQTTF